MKAIRNTLFLVLLGLFAHAAVAGKIVVNHDEWTLSDTGFGSAPGAATFIDNVARFFTGGGAGTFHAYSNNFGLNQGSLQAAFASGGHTYTTGSGVSFDLATLMGYDGVFVAGEFAGLDTAVLVDYVQGGGNVYLAGGTANFGGAAGEANFWNAFLNAFDLGFETSYNGSVGNLDVSSEPHAIFAGVGALYEANGNTVLELTATDPASNVYFDGRYGIYESTTSVPEPHLVALLGLGVLLPGLRRIVRR